jgi:hypothetical protein
MAAAQGIELSPGAKIERRLTTGIPTKWPHRRWSGKVAFASELAGHGCAGRGGTFAKSEPSPSAIVGCARTASRSLG